MEQEETKELLLKGKKRALRLLERKDYSRKELTERLTRDGYSQEIVTQIMEYLDNFSYLSDVRVAENYIRCHIETTSKRKLEYMLYQKGISEADINLAMEKTYKNEDGIPQEEIAIRKFLQKIHIDEDTVLELSYEEKQKIAAKLYRKGFASDKIRKILHMQMKN